MMKHRNKLPRPVWPEILTAFPDITLEGLKALERKPAPRIAKPSPNGAAA